MPKSKNGTVVVSERTDSVKPVEADRPVVEIAPEPMTAKTAILPSEPVPTDTDTPTPSTQRSRRSVELRTALTAPQGASISELCTAFGWQPHSARAALSGLRKSGLEIERVLSPLPDVAPRYRLVPGVGPK
jgi:Protein of unknown function (DUF3489)